MGGVEVGVGGISMHAHMHFAVFQLHFSPLVFHDSPPPLQSLNPEPSKESRHEGETGTRMFRSVDMEDYKLCCF